MAASQEVSASRRELFALLENVDTVKEFFAYLADDVRWTLHGRHPLAGQYRSKAELIPASIGQVLPLLSGGLRFHVKALHGDGPVSVVEMQGVGVALDGVPYDPFYVWVCHFDSRGDTIVAVDAYIDSVAVTDILNRLAPRQYPDPAAPHTDAAGRVEG
ncbi:nuclear transport factor 2 family protein [Streptomyces sp. NPDC002564]|uniref:nuclear transport factor 2 family protein n=1 Tax=Streptomyces sp. NPDC002564 TaxID=3364649 RepID=UPI0036A602D9